MSIENLGEIIKATRDEVFLPDYRATATDADVMGIVLSKYFKWDGVKILEAAVSALEDANFHTEAAVVRDLLTANLN